MKPDQKTLSRPCPARIGISDGTSVIHCGCEGKNASHRAAAEKLKREGVIPWDWADVREAARKAGWTRRGGGRWSMWGFWGEDDIQTGHGWIIAHKLPRNWRYDIVGPGSGARQYRSFVELVDPSPAEVLAAARLVGLDGAGS